MRVPVLNQRIDVYAPVANRDATGAIKPTSYRLWRRLYSKFTYKQGNDQIRDGANQRVPVVSASVIQRKQGCCGLIPPSEQVRPDYRLQFNGYWWDVKAVVPYNANTEFVELLVECAGFINDADETRPVI